ncbi:hypothetical protein VitviT2T_024077 [Vitis vinifera]|uniref:Uncharacterized protein n=1 Tax=Vitis vinifera TaxID=29760 RepID=A0ABY9DH43_VITVI|nr:hypothetical protein VitviT2T_024077 [Vitis vinifera]
MAERHRSQSHCTLSQLTNPNRSRSQTTRSSLRHLESSHQTHKEDFSSRRSLTWTEQPYASTNQSHLDTAASSSRGKRKKGHRRGSRLLDAMRVCLGPQDQQAQAFPPKSDPLKA